MNCREICWNITARCNQNCKYCHRFLGIRDLSYEENLRILSNLHNSGVECITWTGGEALLLDGLESLLRISNEFGIKNKLITNGKLLTNSMIDKIIDYLDSITLSIDSTDNKINNDLGRGTNHFNEIKNILDYIKKKNIDIKVRINSVVCKNNAETLPNLAEFLNSYDIYSWRIFKFMPLREKAITNKDMFDISMKNYNEVIKKIKKVSNIRNIETRTEKDMEDKYVLILANGDIYVTENQSDKKIGNALVNSVLEVLE